MNKLSTKPRPETILLIVIVCNLLLAAWLAPDFGRGIDATDQIELVGGGDGAFRRFDLDYWDISFQEMFV